MKCWLEFIKSVAMTTMLMCFVAGCVAINFSHDASYVFFFAGVFSGCMAYMAEQFMGVTR